MKISKVLGLMTFSYVAIGCLVAFSLSDPQADLVVENPTEEETIEVSEILTDFTRMGNFKASVDFRSPVFNGSEVRGFYGQRIIITDNPNVDRIDVGITSNLISRIEVWNGDKLVEAKELGFMNKMTWGQVQRMSVEMMDESNSRYSGKSQVRMRFTDGAGFFGDIGTLSLNLTGYGSFMGAKSISLFQKAVDEKAGFAKGEFTSLKVWKNFASVD